jgi:hypothetical protein
MKKIDNNHLSYLLGVKVGIESVWEVAQECANEIDGNLNLDAMQMIVDKFLDNIVGKIQESSLGEELLEALEKNKTEANRGEDN